MKNKKNMISNIIITVWVLFFLSYAILPILLLRGNYCFEIHDGLDSYAGVAQLFYSNHLYFDFSSSIPLLDNIERKYLFITFNLYDLLNYNFGYLSGQILTKIVATISGFVCMLLLLNELFPERTSSSQRLFFCISILYAISPAAPIRLIGYGFLPLIILAYLKVRRRDDLSRWTIFSFIYPFFSQFNCILVFVIALWFIATIVEIIRQKRVNINLIISFLGLLVSTLIVNYNYFFIAFSASDTNRGLSVGTEGKFYIKYFIKTIALLLVKGWPHSTPHTGLIVLPFLLISSIIIIVKFLQKKGNDEAMDELNQKCCLILSLGWGYAIGGAAFGALFEAGFRTGILAIDGFQWHRNIELMRCFWYLMLAAVAMIPSKRNISIYFVYVVVIIQTIYVTTLSERYCDDYKSIKNYVTNGNEITLDMFFSPDLFSEIREDIDYQGEPVVAYGFHPSVLSYNNFNALDGFIGVNSMEYHNKFRRIIEPYLNENDDANSYYENWGGRLYIFGDLSYSPTVDVEKETFDLLIDTNALKELGGKYIISRAKISNSDDLAIKIINDYYSDGAIYHLYVYVID